MNRLLLLLLLPLLAAPTRAAEPAPASGWVDLFNGRDLVGWKAHLGRDGAPNVDTFTVRDGLLVCSGRPAGYLYTPKAYRRYTLSFEMAFVKPDGLTNDAAFKGNSGCLIHIGATNALDVWPRSIEVQGMHRQLGLILPIPRSLSCTKTFDAAAMEQARKPVGEFNQVTVRVRGGDMDIELNGIPVSTVRACELTEGPIGFQSEGVPTLWRNLRIREE